MAKDRFNPKGTKGGGFYGDSRFSNAYKNAITIPPKVKHLCIRCKKTEVVPPDKVCEVCGRIPKKSGGTP